MGMIAKGTLIPLLAQPTLRRELSGRRSASHPGVFNAYGVAIVMRLSRVAVYPLRGLSRRSTTTQMIDNTSACR
jgi:hypothetical protein